MKYILRSLLVFFCVIVASAQKNRGVGPLLPVDVSTPIAFPSGEWGDMGMVPEAMEGNWGFDVSPRSKEPYIILRTGDHTEGFPWLDDTYKLVVRYRDNNDNTWHMLGAPGFNGPGNTYHMDIAISPRGERPYIAFPDNGDWNGNVHGQRGTVMMWNGDEWIPVGERGFTEEPVTFFRLEIGPTGIPYVAYATSSQGVVVEKFNGAEWEIIGKLGMDVPDQPHWATLSIGKNGLPIVSALTHASITNDVVWQLFSNTSGNSWVALDNDGWAQASDGIYLQSHTSRPGSNKVYISHRGPGVEQWLTLGYGSTPSAPSASFSPLLPYSPLPVGNQIPWVDMAQNGTPYVVVREWSSTVNCSALKLKRFSGGSWHTVGSEDGFNNEPYTIQHTPSSDQTYSDKKVVVVPKSYPGNSSDIGHPFVAFVNGGGPGWHYLHVRRYIQ